MATSTTTAATPYVAALGSMYKGMDGGRDPSTLDSATFAKGINVATRGGMVRTRPGIVIERNAVYPAGQLVQGAKVWSLDNSDWIVSVHSGYVYCYRIRTGTLYSLGLLRHPTNQCFFEQVDRYMVVQDGFVNPESGDARALLIELRGGVPVIKPYRTRSDGTPISPGIRMPIGTIMKYVSNRLHLRPNLVPGTTEDGRPYFVSGDILQPADPETGLIFQESKYLAGGGAHALPAEMGYIYGMASFRNAATGTGYGNLIVAGRNGISAFDMSIPRASWDKQQLSQVLFYGSGTLSPWSFVNANDDVVYRSQDGIRSIRFTQSRTAGASTLALANVPLSGEVRQYMENEDATFLSYISATFTDNRLFMTAMGATPRYFRALISLDWANVYTLTQLAEPAYDGIWTGHQYAAVMTASRDNRPTTYILTRDAKLLRIDETAYADSIADAPYVDPVNPDLPATLIPAFQSIESRIITGCLAPSTDSTSPDFFTQKVLKFVELRVSNLRRTTEFRVYYRPKGYGYWATLGTAITIPVGDDSAPQIRRKIRFSVDKQVFCDPSTGEALQTSAEFQFAIQWTGYAQIDTVWVEASGVGVLPPSPCSTTEAIDVEASSTAGIELNDFSYTVTL
jgi:hypothetical protein